MKHVQKTGDMVECFVLPLLFMINDNDLAREGELFSLVLIRVWYLFL